MKITPEMTVEEALRTGEHVLDAFTWVAPELRRLRRAEVRRSLAPRLTVEQASRMGHGPLAETLYVLNLVAGEDEARLADELARLGPAYYEWRGDDAEGRPRELLGVADDDPAVHFLDVLPKAMRYEDPQPDIFHELAELHGSEEVLLVRHPFDPVPLRDALAERGYASWAEERRPHEWYVYFYRPHQSAGAVAFRPTPDEDRPAPQKARARAAGA